MSQYDDAANINGGVSPYDTRLKELDEITPTYDELMAKAAAEAAAKKAAEEAARPGAPIPFSEAEKAIHASAAADSKKSLEVIIPKSAEKLKTLTTPAGNSDPDAADPKAEKTKAAGLKAPESAPVTVPKALVQKKTAVKKNAKNQKVATKGKKDAYDGDENTVSQYDDASNINGEVSPYETRMNSDPLPPVPNTKDEKDKILKDIKDTKAAEEKKALPEPAKDNADDIKSKADAKNDAKAALEILVPKSPEKLKALVAPAGSGDPDATDPKAEKAKAAGVAVPAAAADPAAPAAPAAPATTVALAIAASALQL